MHAGLRLAAKVPHSLLEHVAAAASMQGLTYLRIGHTPWPQLEPLRHLTALQRVHLHVTSAAVRALTPLTRLTYLHLHGNFDDLARTLYRLRSLQKLSLGKIRRLRTEDLRMIGRLVSLTALELPTARGSPGPADISEFRKLRVRARSSFFAAFVSSLLGFCTPRTAASPVLPVAIE